MRSRRRRSNRGYIAWLTMAIVWGMVIALAVFSARASRTLEDRPADDARLQAIVLARTAFDSGFVGTRTVPTPHGTARVKASPGGAVVTVRGGTATATKDGVRYER